MSSTPFTEAEIMAFFQQDSLNAVGLTDEEFVQLCAGDIEYQPEVDAFFASLGFPSTQNQTTSEFNFEFEPLPEADLGPLVELNMSPPEFVAFCGYDPSEFKWLDTLESMTSEPGSCLDAESVTEIWSRVLEEVTQKMQESTAVGVDMGANLDAGQMMTPIASH